MRAVVFNAYLQGLGGGERSTFAYARALQEMGYETLVVSTRPLPEARRIEETFGREFAEVPMQTTDARGLVDLCRDVPEVFVNHTFGDFTKNLGRLGVYSQMFPAARVQRGNRRKDVASLLTYRILLNNSSFTKRYTDLLWDYPLDRSHVLHPPVGEDTIAAARRVMEKPSVKQKLIVGIGRYNLYPANKNQKVIIEAFRAARDRNPELADWRLVLIGNRNPDPESEAYYRECLELAEEAGSAVEIRSELPHEELKDYLERAFGYVHAAGAFHLPGEEAFRCEHLGLSIAEAMAHGCVPLVYARGGIFDILDVDQGGIPYVTFDGLVEGMQELASLWKDPEVQTVQRSLARMASKLSFQDFSGGLQAFLESVS